jgi:hypothetical protein
MFCLSRRANVVESFSDGKLFFRIFMRLREAAAFSQSGRWQTRQSWVNRALPFIAGNTRAALAEAQNGDWQVSHGALPGLRRWVTSAHLSNKE